MNKDNYCKAKRGRVFSLAILIFFAWGILFLCLPLNVCAEEGAIEVVGKIYEFDKKSKYEISSTQVKGLTSEGDRTYGTFALVGNVQSIVEKNGVLAYVVKDGKVSLGYTYGDTKLEATGTNWHLVDDKSKAIDGIKLDERIRKGVIKLQTSKDGTKWVDSCILTNEFARVPTQTDNFYEATDMQLMNGCYYRVIIAYELRKKVESKNILFLTLNDYEYKKIAEVYEFYISEEPGEETTLETNQKHSLGERVNTGKSGNGYSEVIPVDKKDPHYGWKLGSFFVNGYTDVVEGGRDTPIFLKNAGDKVTLWFNLEQDIDALNDEMALTISPDEAGYDQYFETSKTNLGRGALFIKYTDHENVSNSPVVYTNYLEANITPNSDTKVQLCEEGDYEVALDYKVKNEKTVLFGKSILPEYNCYRIYFRFAVRNGNCMVYPFDSETGSELSNSATTENGFYLDFAGSEYIDVNVVRKTLRAEGKELIEDVRYNRPAKDGERFEEEGVYILTVSNQYTNQKTIKKIYVGKDDILKAYVTTGLSIEEIESQLSKGAKITNEGNLLVSQIDNQTEEMRSTQFPMALIVILGMGVVALFACILKRKRYSKESEKEE